MITEKKGLETCNICSIRGVMWGNKGWGKFKKMSVPHCPLLAQKWEGRVKKVIQAPHVS